MADTACVIRSMILLQRQAVGKIRCRACSRIHEEKGRRSYPLGFSPWRLGPIPRPAPVSAWRWPPFGLCLSLRIVHQMLSTDKLQGSRSATYGESGQQFDPTGILLYNPCSSRNAWGTVVAGSSNLEPQSPGARMASGER